VTAVISPLREAPEGQGDGPFETEFQLHAWLRRSGLGHLERIGADCLVPLSDAVIPRLARRPLMEVATAQALERDEVPRADELLAASHVFLLGERHAQAEAARDVTARVGDPAELRVAGMHRALVALRSQFAATVPPYSRAVLVAASLTPEPQLPGFVFEDARRWLPERFVGTRLIRPRVALTVLDGEASAKCDCGARLCLHALAAVDAALLWLKEPLTGDRAFAFEQLNRPGWQRALTAIDLALSAQTPKVNHRGFVTWRLKILGPRELQLSPWLHRHEDPSRAKSVAPRQLLELRGLLSAVDQKLARLCELTEGEVTHELLTALEGHAGVFLDDRPEAQVRIERAAVGLVAEERDGAVVLTPGVDGAPLRADDCARALDRTSEAPFFLWDSGPRLLTILDVSEEVRALLEAIAHHGNHFPPESHAQLLERLATAATRVPVAMPRSVMGEAVVPSADVVLRIHLRMNGSVSLEVRTRAIAEAATNAAGAGARDLYVRRGARALHVRRNFDAELAAANGCVVRLGLGPASAEGPFVFEYTNAQPVLALLTAHPQLELEWVDRRLQMIGAAGPGALRVVLEKKHAWFGVLGELSLQGERVALAVLLDAVRREERFIQVRPGTWAEITHALRERLAGLAPHTQIGPQGLTIGPSAAASIWQLSRAGVELHTDAHWAAIAKRSSEAEALEPKLPAGFKAKLRDYQREGFEWLSRLAHAGTGGVLADDMGLGKTVQTLALLLSRAKLGPALVLAPTSVGFNWVDEAARFAPKLRLHTLAEAKDRGALLKKLKPFDVVVASYGLLPREQEKLSAVKFSTVVFDEAQALKNAATLRTRAAAELHGDFKVALTGTPVENHLGELWSLYRIVFPSLFGSWESFRTRFAVTIEKSQDPTADAALARVLQPFMLRRTKAEVEKQLPPRTEIKVPVLLSADEWQLYEDARLSTLSELGTATEKLKEQQRRLQVLASLTRLRLLASHPRLYDPASTVESSKLRAALELITELRAEGHRALVFSQFTSHLALVRELLDARGIPYLYLDGATPRAERRTLVQQFQAGAAPLFLISLKAGGFGLNLTGADNVIHLDPWWNPAVEDQATDRAHRIGQRRPVTVYRLITRGTIEEQLLSLHASKRALVARVLEGKQRPGRLTSEQLLELIATPAKREE
jgi:superfamily II DNA or RNA helicase